MVPYISVAAPYWLVSGGAAYCAWATVPVPADDAYCEVVGGAAYWFVAYCVVGAPSYAVAVVCTGNMEFW
jgi:hypothetical protein